MPSGTGLDIFEKSFQKTFDVGIAEQHAVLLAGMATEEEALRCNIFHFFAKSL